MKKLSGILLFLLFFSNPLFAGGWTFAVLSDPHDNSPAYESVLEEIKTMRANLPPTFEPADFVVVCGDMHPVSEFDRVFRAFFPGDTPAFFPVRGNHEKPDDVRYILRKILPRSEKKAVLFDAGRENVNYYVDWKNVRLIVLEPYWSSSKSLGVFPALKWVERALETAGAFEHVFVAFHRPYFPQEPRTDPFWSLLLKHADQVKAVFNGHIHKFDRRRFPAEPGGICCINLGNSGATGHGDGRRTVVEVRVDGPKVLFRAIRTPDGERKFELKDQWRPSRADS